MDGPVPLGVRGRFESRTFDRKVAAERWLRECSDARDRGEMVDPNITVERALGEVAGRTFLKDPKSKASKRRIAIDDELVWVLSEWFEERPVIADGHVFTTPNGGHLRRSAFRSRIWRPALRAAGLPELHVFHDLRHTHAALLIEQGEHPLVIKERLGHASIQVTMDIYGHLFEGLDRDAATKLGSAFAATRKQQGRAGQGSEVTEIRSRGQTQAVDRG